MKYFSDFSASQKKKLAIVAVVVFLVGFFLGREHVKYQIRSGIQEAFTELGEGLNDVFGGGSEATETKQEKKKKTGKQPISIALLDKGMKKVNYSDVITIDLEFTNNLDKDIKAFIGTVTFYDLFDREIMPVNITYEDGVEAGGTATWEGSIDYNQFMDDHQRLASIEFENVSIVSEITQVVFADGTKEDY